MGLLKSAADLVYTIRFLKLLVTKFEDTGAYKAGIINADGSRNKNFNQNSIDDREAYRTHYTTFHRLVFNLKRIMAKVPGGQSVIARYGAALALIKEHGNLSDKNLEKIHAETGIDTLDMIAEHTNWFMLDNNQLSPGVYCMKNEGLTKDGDDLIKKGDIVRVTEDKSFPNQYILGMPIYEVKHIKTGKDFFVSTAEIRK
jgi:hypothetical protein